MLLDTLVLFQAGFHRPLVYARVCARQLFSIAMTASAETCVFECVSRWWLRKRVSAVDHDPPVLPPFFFHLPRG